MIYPSADIIEQRVGSRYSLVVLAAKRAKQIKEGAPVLIETASTNPLTIALEEIAAGKVTVGEAVIVQTAALESEESSSQSLSNILSGSLDGEVDDLDSELDAADPHSEDAEEEAAEAA